MTKIFVVTGSNKGIGYAIVKGLSEKVPNAVIYLTARNPSLGEASLAKIESESMGKQVAEVKFHQLDVTNDESCTRLAEYLKSTHGGLDVLVNNAGISGNYKDLYIPLDPIDKEAEEVLGVNYYGTKRITNALLPLIRPGGRIVNLCSLMGVMDGSGYMAKSGAYGEKYKQKFKSPQISVNDVDKFVEDYIRLTKEEARTGQPKRKQEDFLEGPWAAYSVSKAADIAFTIALSKAVKEKNITVNGCCPGYVATDINNHSGPLTTDQGAETPIYLATELGLPNGNFFSERKVVPWP
uniref:carbonyl reductase (NADPH) n=1 Tax=Acrobeloides nanus TaxID=290746 RepID=A0A914DM86_9BILA